MLDMLIKGGQVVTPSGVGNWDVGVQGEQIVAVALPGVLPEEGATVIDASGKIVVPGGVEAHAHAAANVQPGARETVSGTPNAGPAVHSLGAIWGGNTTVVDFAPVPTEGDLVAGIHDFINVWQGNAYTDYTTHCIYRESNSPDSIARFHELAEAGFPSVKIFTTNIRPPGAEGTSLTPLGRIDTGRLGDLMEQMHRHGGVLAVHGEDDELVMYNYLMAQQRGLWDWYNVHLIHSKTVEDLAFRHVVRLAQRTGVGMYFVHVTASDGADVISEARASGMPVYGEVLTLALSFEAGQYKESDGMKYHTYPSLKLEEDRNVLWDGIMKGDLSFTATDSSFTTYLDKIAGYQRPRHPRRQRRHRDPDGGQLHRGCGQARHVPGAIRRHYVSQRRQAAGHVSAQRAASPRAAMPTLPSSTPSSRRRWSFPTCTCGTTTPGRGGTSRVGPPP